MKPLQRAPPYRPGPQNRPQEVITGAYDERADVWSAGVVLYVLLSGRPPFSAGKTEDVFREILESGGPDM
jgi:serine/threonine protein kinase